MTGWLLDGLYILGVMAAWVPIARFGLHQMCDVCQPRQWQVAVALGIGLVAALSWPTIAIAYGLGRADAALPACHGRGARSNQTWSRGGEGRRSGATGVDIGSRSEPIESRCSRWWP